MNENWNWKKIQTTSFKWAHTQKQHTIKKIIRSQ